MWTPAYGDGIEQQPVDNGATRHQANVSNFMLGFIAAQQYHALAFQRQVENQRQRERWADTIAADICFHNPDLAPGYALSLAWQYIAQVDEERWQHHLADRRARIGQGRVNALFAGLIIGLAVALLISLVVYLATDSTVLIKDFPLVLLWGGVGAIAYNRSLTKWLAGR